MPNASLMCLAIFQDLIILIYYEYEIHNTTRVTKKKNNNKDAVR